MNNMYNNVIYPADTSGCGWYRMIFPKVSLQTMTKNISFIESMKCICDARFFNNIRSVRLQRQVSNEQYAYFTQFLKPLSDNIGFWLIYEIDDIICYNDIPAYNVGRNAFDNDQFYKNVGIMLNLADIITVTTDFLRDYYIKQYNVDSNKILVIPNYLPRWWIGEAYNLEKRVLLYEENKKKPRIGFPCSSSHFDLAGVNGYNDDFTHILDFIIKTINKYTWVFIGGYPKQLEHLVKTGKIEFRPPSDLLNYPRELSTYNLQLIVAPLQNNVFNKSKCVTADTKIQIKDMGLVNISEIVKKDGKHISYNNLEILSLDKTLLPITYTYKSEIKEPVWEIETEYGRTIKGTYDHKVLLDTGVWKQLSLVTNKDKIKIENFDLQDNLPYYKIKIPCLVTKKLTFEHFEKAQNCISAPYLEVNENFAKFLGYAFGDGYFNNGNAIQITCCARDIEVIDEVKNLISQFGVKPCIYKNSKDKTGSVTVGVNSRSFRMLLEYLGFVGHFGRQRSKILRVPDIIFKSRKSVIKAFIEGLFESDGTVVKEQNTIMFSSKSKKFVQDVQLLLSGFNIFSIVNKNFIKKYGKWYYGLRIRDIETRKFADCFSFTSNFKQSRLFENIDKLTSNANKPHSNYEQVIKSMAAGTDYVYDVTVSEKSCYIGNGILSHNSNIKLLESWALGIPCIAQNLECYNKYTNMVFNNENELQNQIDKVLSSRNNYTSVIKANRKIVDFGDENSPNGWWLEKNLKLWGQISSLPQKTIHIDMAKLMNKVENVVMELK